MSAYDGTNEVVAFSPSRENAKGALEMVESFYDTVHRVGSEVVIVIDEDEPQREAYLDIPGRVAKHHVGMGITRPDPPRIMTVPGGTLTKATNEGIARMMGEDIIVGHVGDDHRFRTPGWDNRIRDVLVEKPGVAYAYDGFRSAWDSAWWTNMLLIRTLGWLAVPGSMHLTIDDVWMDIGAGLEEDFSRLHYLNDVLIEHLHPAGGKVEWRDIVRSHYTSAKRKQEDANLERYRNEDFANDIHKLQSALGLPLTEVTDLKPGVTFRRRLGPVVDLGVMGPSHEELEAFAGRKLTPNTWDYIKAVRLMRQGRKWA